MSRLNQQSKAVKEAQTLLKSALPALKEASKLLGVEAGFCGTPPDSSLLRAISRIEKLSETNLPDLLEWASWSSSI